MTEIIDDIMLDIMRREKVETLISLRPDVENCFQIIQKITVGREAKIKTLGLLLRDRAAWDDIVEEINKAFDNFVAPDQLELKVPEPAAKMLRKNTFIPERIREIELLELNDWIYCGGTAESEILMRHPVYTKNNNIPIKEAWEKQREHNRGAWEEYTGHVK